MLICIFILFMFYIHVYLSHFMFMHYYLSHTKYLCLHKWLQGIASFFFKVIFCDIIIIMGKSPLG